MHRYGLIILMLAAVGVRAEEPRSLSEKGLSDTLKAIHNRGADLYNGGDAAGCQRLFEGALEMAGAALAHRPGEQKAIRAGLERAAAVEPLPDRAFALHELIEEVRKRLAPPNAAAAKGIPVEEIPVLPRRNESKAAAVPAVPKSPAAPVSIPVLPKEVVDAKTSLTGRFFWDGEGLEGVNLMFVQRDGQKLKVFETATGPDGHYAVKAMEAGRYTVVLDPLPGKAKHALPERYRSSETSPLIYTLGPGEKHDFLLK